MTSFILTTPPAVEPVLLADALQQARIDTAVDDNLVGTLITGARQWVENYIGRALVTQTWQMWLDLWPGAIELWWDGVRQGPVSGLDDVNYVSLLRAPLQSVTSVQFFAPDNTSTVWDPCNYFVDTIRAPGRLELQPGATWPVPTRYTNGIMIEYVAGYGNDGTSVPETIKTAIRQLVSHWYENRGEAVSAPTARGTTIYPSVPVPLVIQALLDPYRVRFSGV